jgi:hypothetical protein
MRLGDWAFAGKTDEDNNEKQRVRSDTINDTFFFIFNVINPFIVYFWHDIKQFLLRFLDQLMTRFSQDLLTKDRQASNRL